MPLARNVAENLRVVRMRKQLSQESVARKSGLSVSYVSMLERGARMPPLETLEVIAEALDVSPLDLLREPPPARASSHRKR